MVCWRDALRSRPLCYRRYHQAVPITKTEGGHDGAWPAKSAENMRLRATAG